MNHQSYFDYIESRLTWLSCRVTARGALNMYDINIHCENFYMHLLNLLYGWNLVNANTIQRNAPAIDLVYKEGNVIVQVSSTDTTSFDVNNKITKNNLSIFKDVIEQYDVYFSTIQKIYNDFDSIGNNKSFAVLQTINKEYLN